MDKILEKSYYIWRISGAVENERKLEIQIMLISRHALMATIRPRGRWPCSLAIDDGLSLAGQHDRCVESTDLLNILSVERPIRTAEAFEAVYWLADLR